MSEVDNELTTPLVSICTLVYNHEPYLRECFDGFLMQKTNFAFEVLVHDDASTDSSPDIIREYTDKYPHIFKPIYQKENQYSKGVKVSATFQFPRAKGKYIALCEGDDYWTDPLKLQKQVDFLESHPDYVMCSHLNKIYYQEDKTIKDDWHGQLKHGIEYNLSNHIRGEWYYQPLTVMFRLDKFELQEYIKCPVLMDAVLFFYLLKNGKGYMIPEEMAVYRVHSGGVWSGIGYSRQIENEFVARISLCEIEKSYEAAIFLQSQFVKWIPRSWMLKNWRLMVKTFMILLKHIGFASTLKLYFTRLILNRNMRY